MLAGKQLLLQHCDFACTSSRASHLKSACVLSYSNSKAPLLLLTLSLLALLHILHNRYLLGVERRWRSRPHRPVSMEAAPAAAAAVWPAQRAATAMPGACH